MRERRLLYLLGIPRTTFQTAVPFVLPPGDGGTNGLTFTGGGGGAFTLSAAPAGRPVFRPVRIRKLRVSSCQRWRVGQRGRLVLLRFSSDTAGTLYGDQYTGGQPQIVGSPGAFGGAPSGRITTPTSEIVALSGINLLPVGANGSVMLFPRIIGDISATKTYRIRRRNDACRRIQQHVAERRARDCRSLPRNHGQRDHEPTGAGIGQASNSISGDFQTSICPEILR